MSHNTIASSGPRQEGGTFECTLASVARQEAEHDFRRRRLFIEESRTSAAIHLDKLTGDSARYASFSVRKLEPAHRSADEAAAETASAHGDRGEFNELVQTRAQLAVAGRATANRFMAATVPFVAAAALARPVTTVSDMIGSLNLAERNSITGTSADRARNDVRPQDAPARDAAIDPIVQATFLPAMALEGRRASIAPVPGSAGNEARLPTPFTGTLTSEQVDSLSRKGIDWWEQARDTAQGRDRDQGSYSRRSWAQRAIAERSDSCDREIASLFGGTGESIAQLGMRSDLEYSQSSVDRTSGSSAAESPDSRMAAQNPADEAVAAAAHEVERLRTAVRQTIDELERVRGAVHPPLPALPVNRGTFRIS
jgi:hypothetical protein